MKRQGGQEKERNPSELVSSCAAGLVLKDVPVKMNMKIW
jgi:hypothetical protein